MLRKLIAVAVAFVLTVGSVFADEIKGTFVKFADGKLTLKVDDKEKDFTIPADLKVKRTIKGEDKEIPVSKMLERAKEGTKLTVVTEDGKVKDIKMERRKKKDN